MIRPMKSKDTEIIMEMMERFYTSDAVLTNGSKEIYAADIENCVNDNPYLEGYVFEENNEIQGYAMLAKSFSTEFGKQCIWIEDLFLNSEHRRKGIGSQFFDFIKERYPDAVFRLEVEDENIGAIATYQKNGFRDIPYNEMIYGVRPRSCN